MGNLDFEHYWKRLKLVGRNCHLLMLASIFQSNLASRGVFISFDFIQGIILVLFIGHWKSLHMKVSQGGARGTRTNFFQFDCQKIDILF